jgi:hypothetical protein
LSVYEDAIQAIEMHIKESEEDGMDEDRDDFRVVKLNKEKYSMCRYQVIAKGIEFELTKDDDYQTKYVCYQQIFMRI